MTKERLELAEAALDAVIAYTHDYGKNVLRDLPVKDSRSSHVWRAINKWLAVRKFSAEIEAARLTHQTTSAP